MKLSRKSRFAALFALVLLVGIFAFSSPAYAQEGGGWLDGLKSFLNNLNPVGWISYLLSLIVTTVLGLFVNIEAWILGFVLFINTNIINSPLIQKGFPVTLAIANLGFVLAIIVIAIMTIIRYQTYGIKQALWRLILMAILVNFGLVIAGTLINVADQFTLYFLNETTPGGSTGAVTGSFQGLQSSINFASAISGAFDPHRIFLSAGQGQSAAGGAGELIGSLTIRPLATLVFSIFFLLFMIIVLGVLIVLLLVRYVYLGYLLVILPIAWASFIFPLTRDQWHKWWKSFIKQTVFAPIVVFFLWLAWQVANAMNSTDSIISAYKSQSNPMWAAVSEFLTNIFAGTIEQGLQMTIVLSIMLGGIFAAQGLSIKFADVAQKTAIAGTKGFGGWAARKGGGAVARAVTGRVPPGAPPGTPPGPTQYDRGWRRALNPLNRLTYRMGAPIRATAQRIETGQRTETGQPVTALDALQVFGERARTSPGVVSSVWTGMVKGSGLFKKKGRKGKGRTASGEEVEVEIEDEGEGGGGAAPQAPRGPRGGVPPIIVPPGVTGPGRAEARRVVDEETGDLVTPEELGQRREARDRAEFDRRRAQAPPTTPA